VQKMPKREYKERLYQLQIELVKLQRDLIKCEQKILGAKKHQEKIPRKYQDTHQLTPNAKLSG
jgi:hypothetical protein